MLHAHDQFTRALSAATPRASPLAGAAGLLLVAALLPVTLACWGVIALWAAASLLRETTRGAGRMVGEAAAYAGRGVTR